MHYCRVIYWFAVVLAIAGAEVILLRQQFLNDTSNLECVLKGNNDSWSAVAWTTTDKPQNMKDTIPFSPQRFEYNSANKKLRRITTLKPLENCNAAGNRESQLCQMINSGWNWSKVSELQQNLGPVLDYRWEGFDERPLIGSNNIYNMSNNYWHASLLAKSEVSIFITLELTAGQTFLITLNKRKDNSRISTMQLCNNSSCSVRIDLAHYKHESVMSEKDWTHISIEFNSLRNGTDLIFLQNRGEILKYHIKNLQLPLVSNKRATLKLNSKELSKLRVHDYYIIHTTTNFKEFTLHNLPIGCWQFLYYGNIAVTYTVYTIDGSGNVTYDKQTSEVWPEDMGGWRMRSPKFAQKSAVAKFNITLTSYDKNKVDKFWAFGDARECEGDAWHVSKIEGVKTPNVNKITCTSLLTNSKIEASADPDPVAQTTPVPPTVATMNANECNSKGGFWFWMAVASLTILIFGLLVALFIIMVWNHGYPWKRKEEPFYRRRGSLLSGVRRAPVVAPTAVEMRVNNNNQQQRTYDPAPDRGKGDTQRLVFSNSDRGAVATSGSLPEPSSSGILTVPRSLAPPIPTNVQNLAPLPQRSRSKSPMPSNTSNHVPPKQNKKAAAAPLPDETHSKSSTSTASYNSAFQPDDAQKFGNVKTNTKLKKKRVMPPPTEEPPEYGNFDMTVVDEPIYGKKGPIPVAIDPIYGNFGEADKSLDPIYGNF